jgi:hypothetical protein
MTSQGHWLLKGESQILASVWPSLHDPFVPSMNIYGAPSTHLGLNWALEIPTVSRMNTAPAFAELASLWNIYEHLLYTKYIPAPANSDRTTGRCFKELQLVPEGSGGQVWGLGSGRQKTNYCKFGLVLLLTVLSWWCGDLNSGPMLAR